MVYGQISSGVCEVRTAEGKERAQCQRFCGNNTVEMEIQSGGTNSTDIIIPATTNYTPHTVELNNLGLVPNFCDVQIDNSIAFQQIYEGLSIPVHSNGPGVLQ